MMVRGLLPVLAIVSLGALAACAENSADMTGPRVASAAPRGSSDRADVSLSLTSNEHIVAFESPGQASPTNATTDDSAALVRDRDERAVHEHARHAAEHVPRIERVTPHHGR